MNVNRRILAIVTVLIGIPLLAVFIIVFFVLSSADRSVLLSAKHKFEYDGNQRTYLLYEPSQVTADTKLIVGLHGFSDESRRFAYYTALHNADPDALIVFPDAVKPIKEGIKTGWNSGYCCGSGWTTDTDDAGFIIALVDKLIEEHGIERANVFATGFSNGAFMTQRLATDYPDRFKAVAVASGSIGTIKTRLEPKKPIPILLMHGEQDTSVPYNGGVGGSDPDFTWPDFNETRSTWINVNKCKDETTQASEFENITTFGSCDAETKIITYPQDTHSWHDWRLFNFWHRTPQASQEVVNFFDQST